MFIIFVAQVTGRLTLFDPRVPHHRVGEVLLGDPDRSRTRDVVDGERVGAQTARDHTHAAVQPLEREDGLVPNTAPALFARGYNKFLLDEGYAGVNPWHTVANSVLTPGGERMSGWLLEASQYPAIIPDELSETAYMTNRAIDFIREAGDERWCIHLSYIKPHWPYVAPAPYHNMYSAEDVVPAVRADSELDDPNPLAKLFMDRVAGETFSQDKARDTIHPAYMGLITQIDDDLGRTLHSITIPISLRFDRIIWLVARCRSNAFKVLNRAILDHIGGAAAHKKPRERCHTNYDVGVLLHRASVKLISQKRKSIAALQCG